MREPHPPQSDFLPAELVYELVVRNGMARRSPANLPTFHVPHPIISPEITFGTGRQIHYQINEVLNRIGSEECPLQTPLARLRWTIFRPDFQCLVHDFLKGILDSVCYCGLFKCYPLARLPGVRPKGEVKRYVPQHDGPKWTKDINTECKQLYLGDHHRENCRVLNVPLRCLGFDEYPLNADSQLLCCRADPDVSPIGGAVVKTRKASFTQQVMQLSRPTVVEALIAGDFLINGVSPDIVPMYTWGKDITCHQVYVIRLGVLSPAPVQENFQTYWSFSNAFTEELFITISPLWGWANRIGINSRISFCDMLAIDPALEAATEMLLDFAGPIRRLNC